VLALASVDHLVLIHWKRNAPAIGVAASGARNISQTDATIAVCAEFVF
jgi:hypothetical protein